MSEYLAIKNWEKYQSPHCDKWIRDYTDQSEDEDMGHLSLFQRMVLQGIRRLRGKLGRNVPKDPRYIANAMNAKGKDRTRIKDAIDVLIEERWLSVMGPSTLEVQQEPITHPTDTLHDAHTMLTRVEQVYVNPSESTELTRKSSIERDIDRDKDREETKPCRTAKPTTDPRFREFVDVLSRYHKRFVGEQKLTFSVWFGNRGGKQLKNLLKAEPKLDFDTFEKAVALRARSPGVRHEQPAYEWIFHVLGGPRGVANGQVNKGQQREDRGIEQIRRVVSKSAGGNCLPLKDPLSGGNGRLGVGGLAGNSKPLPALGSPGGHEPPHEKSAKAGSS